MNHELRYCVSRSCNRTSIEFLNQGLHEFPSRLNAELREAVLSIKKGSCDYILLNYGLCGNGTLEISHPSIPMVIYNVHDCIPLLIGDFSFYKEYMKKRPGTFWFSCGWIEGFPLPGSPDYVERYREFYNISIDERRMDIIERMLMENYTNLTFIRWDELGERLSTYCREYTKSCVSSLNRRLGFNIVYDEVKGDPAIIQRFVDGDWGGDEFIIIEPGEKLVFDAERCSLSAGT